MAELTVAALYPERMNIYADRGNLIFLRMRCQWRGIGFNLVPVDLGDRIDVDGTDLIYIGGGQDRDQREVSSDLVQTKKEDIFASVDAGCALLAVCGGFQLLGNGYELDGTELEGLGLCDLYTRREPGERLIGNVEIEVSGLEGIQSPRTLVGFENHGGRTYLGDTATPLGRVVRGHGNNGHDGTEGVLSGGVVGTYLHGPLLPKNAWFADWMIARALARRSEGAVNLSALDDALEDAAHRNALEASRR